MQLPDAEIVFQNLAKQILSADNKHFALVGIHTGGVWLAERLHQDMTGALPLGTLDVSFYRDDFDRIGLHAQVKLHTGRTIRAAINELFDYGRPASISLATLVDRGGRELPIAAQYTGVELAIPADKMLALQREKSGRLSLVLHDKSLAE